MPVVLGCSLSFPAWTSTKRSTWECKILMCLLRRWASLLVNFKNMQAFTGVMLHSLTALKKPICSFIEGNSFLTLLLTFVTLLFHYLRRFWRFSPSPPWQSILPIITNEKRFTTKKKDTKKEDAAWDWRSATQHNRIKPNYSTPPGHHITELRFSHVFLIILFSDLDKGQRHCLCECYNVLQGQIHLDWTWRN